METIENILVVLENKVEEINISIKISFGNTNLMKQQLRHIISSQEHLSQIKLQLDNLIKSTDKNTKFPILPAAVGALLTLIGGTTSEFGIDLTLGAIQNHNNEEERRNNIRQRCILLYKKIEEIIQNCEILKVVANKSFEDKKIMQFLHKKQILNNFIELFGNSAFWLLFFVCIFLIFCTVILLFQLEFGALLVTFILMCITATGSYQVLTYVLNNKEKWKIILKKIADNTYHK